MHISRFRQKKFTDWLISNGFQILVNTNEWEVLRWTSGYGVGVTHKNKHDQLNFNAHANNAYFLFFQKNLNWPAPEKAVRKKVDILTRTLVERDGTLCFYCGLEMPPDDMTREHLLAVNSGGNNHIHNMALAHGDCNLKAGCLSVVDKVLLRDRLRGNCANN